MLAYGNGRSYGDSCLNGGAGVIRTRGLDKLIAWDAQHGVLSCEAGVLLQDIIAFALPQGWFVPVTPGTQFVTIGGAIANDVHGKNHHAAGSFSRHVQSFELLRSTGERLDVDRARQTGVVHGDRRRARPHRPDHARHAAAQARVRAEPAGDQAPVPFAGGVLRRRRRTAGDARIHGGMDRLRRARTASAAAASMAPPITPEGAAEQSAGRPRRVPLDPPMSLVGPLSLRLFNAAYFRQPLPDGPRCVHYRPFFYPLDGIEEWNRIYGPRGFFQFQCVVPPEAARSTLARLLDVIARDGNGSFLAVLKTFGELPSEGLLSFARPGATLALDFANRGEATRRLIAELEAIVMDAGGALYPAKDALMSPQAFRSSYPRWQEMHAAIDPAFSSQFWRRVTADA